jgi:hypothetical protein
MSTGETWPEMKRMRMNERISKSPGSEERSM